MPNAPSNQLTLSVGIPTFNQADYLEATLESLFHQTRPPDEIVVSDHYSTDHTQQVLAKYAGRIRSLQPPPGVTLTGQYNFTLASQTSDWITLLSSDDIARPNFCEVLLRGASARPDAVLVRAGWEHIDATGQPVSQHYMLATPRFEGPPANLLSQKFAPKVNFAAFALKREAYEASGPILDSLESLADWALFVQIAPFGAFVYQHAVISGYRVGHDGNKFRDRLPMWIRDQQRVFNQVMPLAAQRANIKDVSWIGEASRYNCLRYLSNACKEFTLDERPSLVPLFRPWATEVNALDALQRFAAGETIETPMPLGRRLRTKLRPYAQRLYALLRHG